MLTPMSERCAVCWQPILYRPDERDMCEACRLALGEPPTDLGPIVYRPQEGDPCPDCGAVLDEGTALHPDCEHARIMKAENESKGPKDRKGRERL